MRERDTKKEYYLEIARSVSKRSTCNRRQYGAIIVNNNEVVSTGYNGSPRGCTNCCDTGKCYRELNNINHGEMYEKCISVHAEQNAIISASRKEMYGGTLYLAGFEDGNEISAEPCKICCRMIINSGIYKVVNKDREYRFEDLRNMIV